MSLKSVVKTAAIAGFLCIPSMAIAEEKPDNPAPKMSQEQIKSAIEEVCVSGPKRKPRWGKSASATYINYGWQAIQKGQPAKANELFLGALFVGPERPDAYWGLGVSTHMSNYPFSIVESCFNYSIKMIPNVADVKTDYARVLFQRQKMKEARSMYQSALNIDPDFIPALIGMAQIHNAKGETDKVNALIKKVEALETKKAKQ